MNEQEKRIAELEEKVQTLQSEISGDKLDPIVILDALAIEVKRIQKANDALEKNATFSDCTVSKEMRENALAITSIAETFHQLAWHVY